MKYKKIRNYSVGISVGLHCLFLLWAFFYQFPNLMARLESPKSMINVKILKDTSFSSTKSGEEAMTEVSFSEMKPKIESVVSRITKDTEPLKKEITSSIVPMEQPKLILEHQPVVQESRMDQRIFHNPNQHKTVEDLVSLEEIKKENNISKPQVLPRKRQEVNANLADKMLGVIPAEMRNFTSASSLASVSARQEKRSPVMVKNKDTGDLSGELFWDLSVFTDKSDGKKYFKISIKADPRVFNLPVIPKELIILVDSSISIQQDRLEKFKNGMRYCLNNLNEGDVFNVMTFKEDITKFKDHSVEFDPKNVKDAIEFVGKLHSSQRTDVYEALYKTIKDQTVRNPAYIFFLSDGLPTKGITNTQKVLNEISEFNQGKTVIFSYSGGASFNRYLLDFISYRNRGWAEYSKKNHLIADNMGKMYDKFKYPILLNLRYYISGLKNQEIFPKILPDFFKNAEFSLYGQYDTETNLVIQLLGDIKSGETKEFNIEGSFLQAREGDESIARNWAFNKIYHLIGLMEYDKSNKELIKEISDLSKKFHIETPYKEVK